MQAGINGKIKVGFSVSPQARLRGLQTGNHEPLTIIKAVPGDRKREQEVKNHLSQHKLRGEWYEPAPEVLQFIEQLNEPEYVVIDLRAYAVLRRDTESSPTDACPFCGTKHRHGLGDGHRTAHCASDEFISEVKMQNGITLRKSDGYIVETRWR